MTIFSALPTRVSLSMMWVITPAVATAQLTSPIRDLSAADAPIPSIAAALTHDSITGYRWMLPSTNDFSRYTPGMCVDAVEKAQYTTVTWTGWDTVSRFSPGDTLSSIAQTLGRRCASQFSTAKLPAQDLTGLIRLGIMLHDVPLVTSALDRRIAEAPTIDDKGGALLDVLIQLVESSLNYLSTIESLLPKFDALGPSQRWRKVVVLDRILGRYGAESNGHYDTAQLRRQWNQSRAAYAPLTLNERTRVAISPNGAAFFLAGQLQGIPLPALCRSIRGEFLRWPQHYRWLVPTRSDTVSPFVQKNISDLERATEQDTSALSPFYTSDGYAAMAYEQCRKSAHAAGQSLATATFPEAVWFLGSDTTSSRAPTLPVRGHMTMLVVIDRGDGRPPTELASVRRLYEKYRAQGLDVMLLTRTHGSAWASPPLAVDDEVQLNAWYFHTYLKLPMTLAVLRTPMTVDGTGTRAEQPVALPFGMNAMWPWGIMLFDRQGKSLPPFGTLGRQSEVEYETLIRHTLGLPLE